MILYWQDSNKGYLPFTLIQITGGEKEILRDALGNNSADTIFRNMYGGYMHGTAYHIRQGSSGFLLALLEKMLTGLFLFLAIALTYLGVFR